jgi:hypothetical protein
MERVDDRQERSGRFLFDRPKPTADCSASGRRRSRGQPIRGYSLASGLGEGLTALCRKHFMLEIVPKALKLSKFFGTTFSRRGQVEGSCEHGSKPCGSEKSGDFLDSLNNCGLLKKD